MSKNKKWFGVYLIARMLFNMPKRIPLRTKLIVLFIAIALVPLLAVMLITVNRLQNTERKNAVTHARQVAETASEQIKTFVTAQFSVLESIQALYPLLSKEQRESLVEQVLFLDNAFADLAIVNASGKEVVRKNRIEVIGPNDLRDQSETEKFKAARLSGAYVGPLYLSAGKPFFTLSVALRTADGTFLGDAIAEVDARIMQDVVKNISSIGESVRAYIVNDRGIVIAHPDISLVLAGIDLSSLPPVHSALSGTPINALETYQNELKEDVIGTSIPITLTVDTLGLPTTLTTNWTIVTEQQSAVALRAVRDVVMLALIMIVLALLAASVAAIFIAGRIVAPIEIILRGLKEFGQNNLRYRVEVDSTDETRDLADGFNSMAENLGRSVAALKEERETIAVERNKLALVLSGISDAVIAIDLNTNIITFNTAAERLLDMRAEDAVGKSIDGVLSIKAGTQRLTSRAYCAGSPFQNELISVVGPRGKTSSASLLVNSLATTAGTSLGWIITLHDRTKEEAVETIKREFVSIAAHQLRTPLTAIRWATDLFLRGSGKSTIKQKQLIEQARASTERMVVLVNDLLNVARLEEGRLVANRQPTDLTKLIRECVRHAEPEAKIRNHTLTFIAPKKAMPKFLLDEEAMSLAFQNLIENAIRYTPPGGTITLSVEEKNDDLAIKIADTGVGIPDNQKDRVFTKFFRAKNVVQLETEGSGLGLFITKNIILGHGGTISFVSTEGKGTTFTILLPMKSSPSAPLISPLSTATSHART